jgi:L-asparaginase
MLKKIIQITALIMAISSNSALAKSNIIILATGGTIAGSGKSADNSGYDSGKLLIENLVSGVPEIKELANIKAEQFSQIGSQDMDNEIWLKLAKRVNELAETSDVDGIVITHGTDTMEETAYFLNLTVHTKKPIILVGAMRPSTSISADGPLNLYNAIALAKDKNAKNKGVLVVASDNIYAARDVTKNNTINVAALGSNNFGAIGHINYGKAEFYYNPIRVHTHDSEFNIDKLKSLPKVEIVYGYANQNGKIIDNLVSEKIDGIIQAGVGDGNAYKAALDSLIKASRKGILVARSSRTGSGFVVRNSEINDDEYKFITADNLNPAKARILLMLALTQTKDHKKIQEFFRKY